MTAAAQLPALRVLIIDGHPAVGRGLSALVREIPGVQIVGLATRGECGLAQAAEATPDVALVDADLPGLCSEAVVRLLRSRLPQARIVALGIYPERKRTLLQAGAQAFVLKDAGYDALREAIAIAGGVGGSGGSGGSGAAEQTTTENGVVVTAYTATACARPTSEATGARGREERAFS